MFLLIPFPLYRQRKTPQEHSEPETRVPLTGDSWKYVYLYKTSEILKFLKISEREGSTDL